MQSIIDASFLRAIEGVRSCFRQAALLSLLLMGVASAQGQSPEREIFTPSRERGPIVIVVSGQSGPPLYRDYSTKLAEHGYYVVLVNGNDISVPGKDGPGITSLRSVIREAQSADKAVAGRVALVGFSVGGIGVLGHGAPLKDQVAGIVLYYPALTFVSSQLTQFASAMRTPALVLVGAQDRYSNCCLLETMKLLEQTPKSVPLQLVVYPDAGHAFNLDSPNSATYRKQDADDAWNRTLAFLGQHLPLVHR